MDGRFGPTTHLVRVLEVPSTYLHKDIEWYGVEWQINKSGVLLGSSSARMSNLTFV